MFQWSADCQSAFEELKIRFVVTPVLSFPNFEKSFILETDASMKGLGVVLSQLQDDRIAVYV